MYPMIQVFQECQETSLSHERLCASLKTLYDKMPPSHFAEDFFELCRYCLVSSDRTAYKERTVDFISRAVVHISTNAADRDDGTARNILLIKTFLFCAKYHECIKPAPRFRCVQIMHKLLEAMGSEACLPVELFDIIQNVLLRRVKDVKHTVRIQAVLGLARLQSPADKNCPVIKELIWLSRHDTSPDVRRAAVAAIVLTTVTLSVVVERCRDVSDAVRKTAFGILAERSVLRPLSIAKRISILQSGLTDTSRDVRKSAVSLVLAWFKLVENDPILLLRRLDTEGVPNTSRLCLERLLENLDNEGITAVINKWADDYLDEKHVPKEDRCSVECVFFWRVTAEYLVRRQEAVGKETHNSNGRNTPANLPEADDTDEISSPSQIASLLERILPCVTDYVDFIVQRVDCLLVLLCADADYNENVMEAECVLENSLRLCESLDLADEFGRRRLFAVVRQWLVSPQVPAILTQPLLLLFFILESNVQIRVAQVTEITNELLDAADDIAKANRRAAKSSTTLSVTASSTAAALLLQTPANDDQSPPPKKPLTKARETYLRIKVAEVKVKLNELNESLNECVRVQEFERASALRDECARLDEEKNLLLQELAGVHPPGCTPETLSRPALTAAPSSCIKQETIDEVDEREAQEDDAEDEEDEEDGGGDRANPEVRLIHQQSKLLARLPIDVILKTNKMIAITVQKSPTLWVLPPSLRSLVISLILPSVQHTDLSVRNTAILALGVCCSMDLELTKLYLPLFYEALKMDHAMVGVTAVKCIVDSFLVFGLQPFIEIAERFDVTNLDIDDLVLLNRGQPNGDALETGGLVALRLLAPLVELLESDDADLRITAGLGLAKVFLYDRLISGQVLSRLLLLWFSPQTADLPTLSQTLGVFFTDYACSRPERQACVADAVLPTLTALLNAPASSPLSEIDAGLVVSLLVRLTDASCLSPAAQKSPRDANVDSDTGLYCTDNPCHDDLAMRLCSRVLGAPQSSETRLYIRVLSQLRLSQQKPALYSDLLRMTDLMFTKAEKPSHLCLHRFKRNIQTCIVASGLCLEDFLPAGTRTGTASETPKHPEVELLEMGEEPPLLDPEAPSEQLGYMDEVPGRKSTVRNNELRSTLAGLSFRGPSLPQNLLVFEEEYLEIDEDDEEEEEESLVPTARPPPPASSSRRATGSGAIRAKAPRRATTKTREPKSAEKMPPPPAPKTAPRNIRRTPAAAVPRAPSTTGRSNTRRTTVKRR